MHVKGALRYLSEIFGSAIHMQDICCILISSLFRLVYSGIQNYRGMIWGSNPSGDKRRGSETNVTAVGLALSPAQSVLRGPSAIDKATGV